MTDLAALKAKGQDDRWLDCKLLELLKMVTSDQPSPSLCVKIAMHDMEHKGCADLQTSSVKH